jgi:hypothetical protein
MISFWCLDLLMEPGMMGGCASKNRAGDMSISLDQRARHPQQREETVQPYDEAHKQYRRIEEGDKTKRALFGQTIVPFIHYHSPPTQSATTEAVMGLDSYES